MKEPMMRESKIEVEQIPAWVNEFMARVSETYEIGNPSDKTIHWKWMLDEEDIHLVVIYPAIVEIEGSPHVPGDIRVDVAGIIALFEEIEDVTLSINSSSDSGELLSIAGTVDGHDVWLHLLDGPPEDEVPTTRLHPDESFEDLADTEGRS